MKGTLCVATLGALALGLAACAPYPQSALYGDGTYATATYAAPSYAYPAYTYAYPGYTYGYNYSGTPDSGMTAENPTLSVPPNYALGTSGPSVSNPNYLGGGPGSSTGGAANASGGSSGTR